MISPSERVARLLRVLAGRARRRRLEEVRALEEELSGLTDEQLRERAQTLLGGRSAGQLEESMSKGWLTRFSRDLAEGDAEVLALAAAGFSRFPPGGLDAGCQLYDEQLQAATHLLLEDIVQMDTGEGKTYAIVAAGLALLRAHRRVYIVTANPYLAARDAAHTASLWHGLGISVGRTLPQEYEDSDDSAWEARVVYTTLPTLGFRTLSEDLGVTKRTIDWSAVLLDEVDAILLEQSGQKLINVRATDPSTKDWSQALQMASLLDPSHVQIGTGFAPDVRLTPAGETFVLEAGHGGDLSPGARLLLLRDVELAYTATSVAVEGHHYEVRAAGVVTIDATSGWETPGVRADWVAPLEQSRNLQAEPRHEPRHVVDGMTVLRRFRHIAGTSGTVVHEALEYLLLLGLRPALVPPRVPRRDGRLPDMLAPSTESANEWIAQQVVAQGPRRPILIATDSTQGALELAHLIAGKAPAGVDVRAVVGASIADEVTFEKAGEPGVTIVSTRTAGRGVDIALSAAARTNGGAMLIAAGHSNEARVDRQLLGRVGRNGDPFSAQFINTPQDPFMRFAGTEKTLSFTTGLLAEPVSSRMFNRQLANAQTRARIQRLGQFARTVERGTANATAYELLRSWRTNLGTDRRSAPPDAFLTFLVDRFFATRYPGLAFEADAAQRAPETVATELAEMVGRPGEGAALEYRALAPGRSADGGAAFKAYLRDALEESLRENEQVRALANGRSAEARQAVVDVRLLDFLRELLVRRAREREPDSSDLALALSSAAPTAAGVDLSEAIAKRYDELEDWLSDSSGPPTEELQELEGANLGGENALRRLVSLTCALVLNEGGVSPHAADRLESLLARARSARLPLADSATERAISTADRSGWFVASETMDRAAQGLMAGLDHIEFELWQAGPSRTYSSSYAAKVESLRQQLETEMATEVCVNLLAAKEPSDLDEVFRSYESQIADPGRRAMELTLPALPVPTTVIDRPDPISLSSAPEELVPEYFEALQQRLGEKAPSRQELYSVLAAFNEQALSGTLTDPDRVAVAYAGWKDCALRQEFGPWRRRQIDAWVKGYLSFLFEHGLAAPLPSGVVQSSQSFISRARTAFSGTGFLLGLVMLAMVAVGGGALALIPHGPGPDLSPALALAERLLGGGFLSSGSALGPALAALVSGAYVGLFLGQRSLLGVGITPIERTTSLGLLIIGAIAVVSAGPDASVWQDLVGVASCIALVAAGLLLRNLGWTSARLTRWEVSAGLAAGLAGWSALPWLVDRANTDWPYLVAAVTALVLLTTSFVREARIDAVAMEADSDPSNPGPVYDVALSVRARLSITHHIFALALSWAVSSVIFDAGSVVSAVVAGVAYAGVLVLWARALARAATDPNSWRQEMRGSDQDYRPTTKAPDLAAALAAARRLVLGRELLTVLPLIALATGVSLSAPSNGLEGLPVGLAALTIAVIVCDFGLRFLASLIEPLRGVTAIVRVDAESGADLSEYTSDLIARATRRSGVLTGAVVGLSVIANGLDIGELVLNIAKWIWGLFF